MKMLEIILKAEKDNNIQFSFVIRCDDKNKPKEILTDMYFHLWEIKKINKILSLCEKHNLRYDFVIQTFDTETDSIEEEIYIVSTNYKN